MLFNSLEFLVFFIAVFAVYWGFLQKNLKVRNLFILVVSYIFYGWWDYRFLGLIAFSTLVDFYAGQKVSEENPLKTRKIWLAVSLVINLGMLGFFKYYNFFIDSFIDFAAVFNFKPNVSLLEIVLPVGISFYTFQTLSYTLDVYKGSLKPTRDLVAFSAFVSFFPQLVAGPIERASHLLPQILTKRTFDFKTAMEGTRLIMWGFFKKIVIADSLAPSVNEIFSNYSTYGGDVLLLGAVFFAFQIYGDFSGYSDIARGISKWMGFDLMINFNFPYFSRNIGEFWRRWHISLSTWFRDYIYIPLGGSRVKKSIAIRNVFVIFLLSGFWHGANWTFIVWGAIHALLFIPSFIAGQNKKYTGPIVAEGSWLPSLGTVARILINFMFVTLAWVFFRADSLSIAFEYIGRIFSAEWFASGFLNPYNNLPATWLCLLIGGFTLAEFFYFMKRDFVYMGKLHSIIEFAIVFVLIVLLMPVNSKVAFIYFQF